MKGLFKGVKSVFTAEGIGAFLAIFALLGLAIAMGYGPDYVAGKLRSSGVGR